MLNKNKLIEVARTNGIREIEVYEESNDTMTICYNNDGIDNIFSAKSSGYSIRANFNKKIGYYFIDSCNSFDYKNIVQELITNARQSDEFIRRSILVNKQKYPKISKKHNSFMQCSTNEKHCIILKIFSEFKADPRVLSILNINYTENKTDRIINNSKKMHLSDTNTFSYLAVEIMTQINGKTFAVENSLINSDLDNLCIKSFVDQTISRIVTSYQPIEIDSKKYNIIIKNNVMADLFSTISDHFSGENVADSISIFSNQMGNKIFSNSIDIIDNPFLKTGYKTTSFDDEGSACKCTVLVRNGSLLSLLHNKKSSFIFNCDSTGNGFNHGFNTCISIAPTNLYISPKNNTLEELIYNLNDGIFINEIVGLSSSFDYLTTEYSLHVRGFLVINSKIHNIVEKICITGNLIELLNNAIAVGNDLYFNTDGVGAPSILFSMQNIVGNHR